MDYFVTGSTGFIGTKLVERLVDDGHEVVALTRNSDNAAHLPAEVTVVEGNITDRDSIRESMEGVDGVFHMAAWFFIGPGKREKDTAESINVEGTRNVLELIDELDIPKSVYTSTVGVYGNTDGKAVDETHRPEDPGLCVYFQSKWRAHYEVAQPLIEDGLPVVVVQPGAVYGPGDKEYGSVRGPLLNWLKGDLPMIPRKFTFPFDYVEDVVDAHINAMEDGEIGEEYIIANEPREVVEVFDVTAKIAGKDPPRNVSPIWFNILATLLSPIHRVWPLPEGFEPEMLRTYGSTVNVVDNSKAQAELNVEHRPLEDGLREYLEWEFEQLGLDPTDITESQPMESAAGGKAINE